MYIASLNSSLEGLWHFVMYCCCITAGYDSFPCSNNDHLLSGWEQLYAFTALKRMEMCCLCIVWQVAACQDLEGLAYCYDRHQTVLFLFLWQRRRDVCVCVWQRAVGYPCGFNYCSIVAWFSLWHRTGFDVGLIPCDSWMLGWSGLLMQTSHCYPHFLSRMAVWKWKLPYVCVRVCTAALRFEWGQSQGCEREREREMLLGNQLVPLDI